MDKKNSIKRAKRQSKVVEENLWDCSVCTYRNTAEAFKCLMCDVRKGTSTRKPRINTAIAAQQAALPGSVPGAPGGIPGSSGKRADGKRGPRSSKKRRQNAPRLRNVDRSSAQTREVTVNSVTVVITEYKPKKTANASVSSGSSDIESSDTGPTNATTARP